jgi:hypothetical protein
VNIGLKCFISFSFYHAGLLKGYDRAAGAERQLRVSQKQRSAGSKQSAGKIELGAAVVEQIPLF